ncbi:ABC transporter permease [Myxococcota bacterium]|nr:ABC transporter permease [Myxococcota bacterium]
MVSPEPETRAERTEASRGGRGAAFARALGRPIVDVASEAGAMALVLARVIAAFFPPRIDRRELLRACERFGYQSAPIVIATAFFTGGIMTLQSLPYVQQMQAMRLLPWAASFATLREVGPVLIGLMFSGRVGSNNTAELGTMVVTEQVDAMRLLAIDPYELLVVPRFIAMVVMMTSLTIIGDLCAIGGAMLTARMMAGVELEQFVMLARDQLVLADFTSGLAKAAAFGAVIAVMSCHHGLRASGGARGVGRAVNASVVGSALGIIVLDFLITPVAG